MRTSQELEACAQVVAANLLTLDRLAKNFSTYFTGTVTLESLVSWLLQFPTPQLVSSAIRVIAEINFIDDTKLAILLSRAFDRIPEDDRTDAQFCTIGRSFDSGPRVSYSFSKALGLREEDLALRWIEVAQLESMPSRTPLVFVDDNLASGTQFRQFLAELDSSFDGKREHLSQGLPVVKLEELKKRKIYLIVAADLGEQRAETERAANELGFDIRIFAGSCDVTRWLEFGNSLWSTVAEAEEFRGFSEKIGRAALSGKGWKPETLESRLLGYGNSQRLTVFSHNVPKTLVTLFWKFGTVDGVSWIPLFPERADWSSYREKIQADSAERRLLARLIVSGGFGKTAPLCRPAIELDGEPIEAAQIMLPSDEACAMFASKILDGREPLPIPQKARSAKSSTIFMDIELQSVEGDTSTIRDYNQRLEKYRNEVDVLSKIACRIITLPLRIYNEGTATANEVMLTLELPEGVLYHESIPRPPTPPKKPVALGNIGFIANYHNPAFASLRDIPVIDRRVRQTRDRGRRLLDLFIGKILPSTFRDFSLEYLQLPVPAELQIGYSLVYEEASRPIKGSFSLSVVDNGRPPPYVVNAWKDSLD